MISTQDRSETLRTRFPRAIRLALFVLVATTLVLAWSRVGLLDLPKIPSDITETSAGLDRLNILRMRDVAVRGAIKEWEDVKSGLSTPPECDDYVDDFGTTLENITVRVTRKPADLALGNAYRMEVFKLRRSFLSEARQQGDLTPKFPPHLERQPIAFFEELVRQHPSRESKLQLALAWVDEMLLFPALEIKAPSSVQSVDILSEILEELGNEYYVPALFARGLNHLHRPSRLVWPETSKTPPDAAVQDIAKCVAIGRKLKVGSSRLQAILALTLGDAYVKAGRHSVARSWWQIAQNLSREDVIQQAVLRRYGWGDEEILDRLEEELDRARTELDHPMTDLALMWN